MRERRRNRKHPYEDHANHEAWAIPYGDLITLLLAFFVVMYAISSVNEGKYRVLSNSLVAAFRGTPTTTDPAGPGEQRSSGMPPNARSSSDGALVGEGGERIAPQTTQAGIAHHDAIDVRALRAGEQQRELDRVAGRLENALAGLIQANLVSVHRSGTAVEVQIRTDILFTSGQARLAAHAMPVLEALAATLNSFPNPLRVEGHTDNVPIRTNAFRSNWELSAARAASVVHLFADHGVDPSRLSVIGLSEFHPVADNRTEEGRNANRRVVVAILGNDTSPSESDPGSAVTP